jgi:hypothetical protein
MPYTEALRVDREQRTVVDQIMRVEGIERKLDSPEVEHVIDRLMAVR